MKSEGFSLVELLICLMLLSIILLCALPDWSSLFNKYQVNSAVNHLVRLLISARQQAIIEHGAVIVCGSRDGEQCDGQWSRGFLSQQENSEHKYYLDLSAFGLTITWRGFPQRDYLKFEAMGFMSQQNGTFVITKNNHPVAQVILSKSGRARTEIL